MPIKSNISFFFQNNSVSLNNRSRLKAFIKLLFKNEKKQLKNLNYIFCSDKELLKINQTFLKHNYYTDILTFDLSSSPGIVDAEVYISIERIRENAYSFGFTLKSELHRVIFHGALHLCGYKDQKNNEQEEMRNKEDFYLSKYFNNRST
jgi:rRNA maturation RNase YbeY